MTRTTSIESYNAIKANGLLKKLMLEVYETLYRLGPMTQGEVYDSIKSTTGTKRQIHSFNPRFSELRRRGVIASVGEKRKCRVTGEHVLQWDVTDLLPGKIVKAPPATREKELKAQVKDLQREIKQLKKQLSEFNGQPRLL